MKTAISIIIPVYNRFQHIPLLLDCLAQQSVKNIKVIIVDHGTMDLGPIEDRSFPVEVIKRSPQLWFTGAVNEGLRHALAANNLGNYLMIINDDVLIKDHDWLKKILDAAIQHHPCLVGSQAVDAEEKIIYAGIRLNAMKFRYEKLYSGQKPHAAIPNLVASDVLPTRSIIFPRDCLREIGLLDEENLPQYGSDYEWTARAKRKGYKLFILNTTKMCTEIIAQNRVASGRNIYVKPKLRNFINDVMNPVKSGNFITLTNYSRLTFSAPYRHVYTAYHTTRKVLGFFYVNFIRSASLARNEKID